MPVLWKYIICRFLRVFTLCVFAFIGVMLVLRLNDIARFAAQTHEWHSVALFLLYQIPYILPFAISISCLTASFITMRSLCDSFELSVFRAARLSISKVVMPIVFLSMLLSLANFYLASELHPMCRLKSRELIAKSTLKNPFFLLSKSKNLRLKGTAVELSVVKPNKKAKNLTFVTHTKKNNRIGLLIAKDLRISKQQLKARQVTLIGSIPTQTGFDQLLVENEASMEFPGNDLTLLLGQHRSQFNFDSLPWRALSMKASVDKKAARAKRRMHFEQIRRISYSFYPFTFTAIGLSFGIHIGRAMRKRGGCFALLLAALCLASLLIGKSFEKTPFIAAIGYFLPPPNFASLRLLLQGLERSVASHENLATYAFERCLQINCYLSFFAFFLFLSYLTTPFICALILQAPHQVLVLCVFIT